MKQVIVMRKDLNMRKGKMCAQAAHATLGSFLRVDVTPVTIYTSPDFAFTGPMFDWLQSGMKKVVVGVDSEAELLDIVGRARAAHIKVFTVTDAGLTEFDGPTLTCAALGPHLDGILDPITGGLKLL